MFFIKSNHLKRKLARRAFVLQKYYFDIIHNVGKVNQDVYGLDQNLSSNEEDIIGVHLYGDVILEAI
jgi:hypothetical protein